MSQFETEILVGRTDEHDFVAVRPPITVEELILLSGNSDVHAAIMKVGHIAEEPDCTLLQISEMNQDQLEALVVTIGVIIGKARNTNDFKVDPRPIPMPDATSNPFTYRAA